MNYKKIIIVLSFIYFSAIPAKDFIGLGNPNINICFMNALLQCLYHTEGLTKFLDTISKQNPNFYKPNSVATEYIKFITMYETALAIGEESITPIDWCEKIWSLEETNRKPFPRAAQGDSDEFLKITLGHLGLDYSISDINQDQITKRLPYPLQQLPKNTLTDILGIIIKGYNHNIIRSIKNESSLTLDIVESFSELRQPETFLKDLQAAINKYLEKEHKIFKLPQYLPIAMKRFTQDKQKIDKNIPFPLELDLSQYLDKDAPKQDGIYELYGIVLHIGDFLGGHYISLVKVNNKWYYCNDSTVNERYTYSGEDIEAKDKVALLSTSNNHENPTPYILFYKQKSPIELVYESLPSAVVENIIEEILNFLPFQIEDEIADLNLKIQNNTNKLNAEAEKLKKSTNTNKRYKAQNEYEYYEDQNKIYEMTIEKLRKLNEDDFRNYFNSYLLQQDITLESIQKSIEIRLIDAHYLVQQLSTFIQELMKEQSREEFYEHPVIKISTLSDASITLQEVISSLNSLAARAEELSKKKP